MSFNEGGSSQNSNQQCEDHFGNAQRAEGMVQVWMGQKTRKHDILRFFDVRFRNI